jgi:site-specific recombinase
MSTNKTAQECREQAHELRRAAMLTDSGQSFALRMLLERAAREIDHLSDLVQAYSDMANSR